MKIKVVTTVSSVDNIGLKLLEKSCIQQGLDFYAIHNPSIGWDWGGWDNHYNWLKNHAKQEGYTHVIYTDGFDTLALAGMDEVKETLTKVLGDDLDRMIYSVEKHWFPHEGTDVAPKDWQTYFNLFNEKIKHLPDTHRWRYANGGQYAGSVDALIRWYEAAPKKRNNQAWANAFYSEDLTGQLILDFNCELFQSLSHSGSNHGSPEEFTIYNNRLINNLTRSKPCFVHNNGIKNPKEAQFMYDILNYGL